MAIKNKEINPGLNWYNRWPRNVGCPARKVEPDLVFVSGQLPIDSDGNVVGLGNVQEQARFAFTKFKECIELAGGSMDDVVEIQSFHKDVRDIPPVLEVAKEFFVKNKPTWCATGTSGLDKQSAEISIAGLAMLNARTKDINPGLGWYEKPPWDVAVPCKVANDLVVIGQMGPLDEKGKIVGPGNVLEQTRYAMKKIAQCMEQAGGTTDNIADFLTYSTDQRAQVAQAAAEYELMVKDKGLGPQVSESVVVTTISMSGFLHQGIMSQVHVYGVLGDKRKEDLGGWITWKQFYPAYFIPYALKMGRYVFIAGAVMFDQLFYEATLEKDLPSIKAQARWALQEYQRFLGSIGATMDNVVFIQPYSSVPWIKPIMEIAHEFFKNEKPAWTSVGNRGLFLPGQLCEIYGMAIVEEDSYQSCIE